MKVKQMVIAAVFLWLLAIAGISNANAAQLTVLTPGLASFVTIDKCADASLATTSAGTPTNNGTVYPSVELSGIPVACQGVNFELRVFGAGGSLLASADATPNSATHVFATGNYTAASVVAVVVRVEGWVFTTAWTPPTPPPTGPFYCEELTTYPGNDWESPQLYGTPTGNLCTVTVTASSFWGNNKHFNMSFTVSGASNWRVTVDFTDPFFNGLLPSRLSSNGNPLAAPGYSCGQLPTFVGQTNLGWAPGDRPTGYLEGSSVGGGGNLC